MHGLRSAAGFVQTKVADRLTTRYVPHIAFILDEGVKKSIEIARLIREANELSAATGGSGPSSPEALEENADADESIAEQSEPAKGSAADRPA
jgi:ribosome-binding factor A